MLPPFGQKLIEIYCGGAWTSDRILFVNSAHSLSRADVLTAFADVGSSNGTVPMARMRHDTGAPENAIVGKVALRKEIEDVRDVTDREARTLMAQIDGTVGFERWRGLPYATPDGVRSAVDTVIGQSRNTSNRNLRRGPA